MTEKMTVEQWLAIRREAGLKIDPETAEVEWDYAQVLDPYGVDPNLPEEYRQVGRAYFARSPGSDIWVWFGDLPEATSDALWEKHKRKLAFPAGLEGLLEKRADDRSANLAASVDEPKPSAAAHRMRLHRHRRRRGMRSVRILLSQTEIESLVRRGYLEDQHRSDPAAIEGATECFITDALFEPRDT